MLDIRKLNARGSNLMRYQVCITTDPVPTTAFQPYQLRRASGMDGSNLNQRQHDSWVEHNPGLVRGAGDVRVFKISTWNFVNIFISHCHLTGVPVFGKFWFWGWNSYKRKKKWKFEIWHLQSLKYQRLQFYSCTYFIACYISQLTVA